MTAAIHACVCVQVAPLFCEWGGRLVSCRLTEGTAGQVEMESCSKTWRAVHDALAVARRECECFYRCGGLDTAGVSSR